MVGKSPPLENLEDRRCLMLRWSNLILAVIVLTMGVYSEMDETVQRNYNHPLNITLGAIAWNVVKELENWQRKNT
jgi:hypothetical protein